MKITTVFSDRKYADYLLAVTKENYKFAIHPDNTIKIAAIDHNIITSMCILTKYNKNKYHLTALYTLSDYRGEGAGRKILDYVKEHYKNVYFSAWLKNNVNTIRFYKKYGLKPLLDTNDKRFYKLS